MKRIDHFNTCERCGKKYRIRPSHSHKRKHCSMFCARHKEEPFVLEVRGKYTVKRYLKKYECSTCAKVFYSEKKNVRFCSKKCIRKAHYCPKQKHKIVKRSNGYFWIFDRNHPQANRQGYVYLHRIIAEQKLNRPIEKWEVVHHIDMNKSNNSPENLQVMSEYDHAKLHAKERWTRTRFFHKDEAHCGKIDAKKESA